MEICSDSLTVKTKRNHVSVQCDVTVYFLIYSHTITLRTAKATLLPYRKLQNQRWVLIVSHSHIFNTSTARKKNRCFLTHPHLKDKNNQPASASVQETNVNIWLPMFFSLRLRCPGAKCTDEQPYLKYVDNVWEHSLWSMALILLVSSLSGT